MKFFRLVILIIIISSCNKNDPEDINPDVPPRPEITMENIKLDPSGQSNDTLHPICVIADFEDSKLEDMSSGLNTIDKVTEILNGIEKHWIWMSQGVQSLQWTIVRITLDRAVHGESSISWYDYRQAVTAEVLQKINLSEHDNNNDNIADAMFVIACNNSIEPEYLIGGASQHIVGNAGANMFVDGQNSYSIQSKAFGNFSHEIGHNLGLPDIYGGFDNVQYLTIMSDSWPTPPYTFSAYEKYMLSWAEPIEINETQHNIELMSGETGLDFIKLSTNIPNEYFLVEYRKRQSSTYTSLAPVDYNGVVIYHIDDSHYSNGENPPHLSVVPADGQNYFGKMLAQSAFWYPDNESMPDTCKVATYDGSACNFVITDFEYTENGMSLSVVYE